MVCAGPVPATVSSTTERETTRLVMRHLARWGSSDTHDTPHTVRRVTGGRVGRAGVALVRQSSQRAVFTPNSPFIGHWRVRAGWNAPTATKIPAKRPQDPQGTNGSQ